MKQKINNGLIWRVQRAHKSQTTGAFSRRSSMVRKSASFLLNSSIFQIENDELNGRPTMLERWKVSLFLREILIICITIAANFKGQLKVSKIANQVISNCPTIVGLIAGFRLILSIGTFLDETYYGQEWQHEMLERNTQRLLYTKSKRRRESERMTINSSQ